jgi:hypothetical protein
VLRTLDRPLQSSFLSRHSLFAHLSSRAGKIEGQPELHHTRMKRAKKVFLSLAAGHPQTLSSDDKLGTYFYMEEKKRWQKITRG